MIESETDSPAVPAFEALGLSPALCASLSSLGYEEPTPIQSEAIPALLSGRDLIGLAATGTGKTAAFGLPLLERIKPGSAAPGQVSALILVPTRELAVQVSEALYSYGKAVGVRVLAVYGGTDIKPQLRRLKQGIDVVVATPGRAIDHMDRGSLNFKNIKVVVLDEADEMLDMGFAEDLEKILGAMPEERQTALFSATLAPRIERIAEAHLRDPLRVRIKREELESGEIPKVRQTAYLVPRAHKRAALGRLLDVEAPTSALVFCRTRTEVDELTDALQGRGYAAEALHGGMSQDQRDRVLKKFKSHAVEILVATDVAARGLHVEKLSHVVNYDLPTAAEAYVHRIGRTGRAGREGVALTLLEPRESHFLRNIERLTKQKIEIKQLPTVADLRARRLELTTSTIREALTAGDLDAFRSVIDTLGSEYEMMDIALAAVKVVHTQSHEAGTSGEETEIPTAKDRPQSADRFAMRDRTVREGVARFRNPRDAAAAGASGSRDRAAPRAPRAPTEPMVKLFVGAGRAMGMRPADLVGAIANEGGLESKRIGAIDIQDRHAFVELPVREAPRIVEVLRNATIRGRKVMVRIDRAR